MLLNMLDTSTIHREILALLPDVRRTIAKVLRSSRYYTDDHIEECMGDIVLQIFDYGVRTFDASKGSAKSHFTCFAKSRALNWLNTAHRRFEAALPSACGDEGDTVSPHENIPAEHDTFAMLVRAQEAALIRAAFETLEPRERALLAAFERTHSWGEAAAEIGVSPATASRMKASIALQLR